MNRVCVVYSKVRRGGISGQCNNRRGATAMHKDGSCRRTKTPTFAGRTRFPSTASQMRDEALALPLRIAVHASRRSHQPQPRAQHRHVNVRSGLRPDARDHHSCSGIRAAVNQPNANTESGSHDRLRLRRSPRGSARERDVRDPARACYICGCSSHLADAARTSETPENWIGSRLA